MTAASSRGLATRPRAHFASSLSKLWRRQLLPGQTTRDCPYLLRRAHLDATQSSSSPWVSKDRFLAGPNGRLHPRPTGYSDTAHRKVRNSVLLGPPTYTVDRTVFELWLGGLFPSRACSDATPVIAPRHPLPGRGNSPGTHYRGCDPAKTSPVRARPLIPAEAEISTHIWEWRNGCLSIDTHSNSAILSVSICGYMVPVKTGRERKLPVHARQDT